MALVSFNAINGKFVGVQQWHESLRARKYLE